MVPVNSFSNLLYPLINVHCGANVIHGVYPIALFLLLSIIC